MEYISVDISCDPSFLEILIAEYANIGFSAFQENEKGFVASIESENWKEVDALEINARYNPLTAVTMHYSLVPKENWNAEWEKNFDPAIIEDRCIVKAPFHKDLPPYEYELIIMPKMSFGTGHHATTRQMLSLQLEIDHSNKRVLDVGTGTGVLAIMALKKGASMVEITDVDDWCIENSIDNLALNGFHEAKTHLGEIKGLTFEGDFDIILANINKNILLNEIRYYVSLLSEEGVLLLSGIYLEDISDVEKEVNNNGLFRQKMVEKDNWVALQFNRNQN